MRCGPVEWDWHGKCATNIIRQRFEECVVYGVRPRSPKTHTSRERLNEGIGDKAIVYLLSKCIQWMLLKNCKSMSQRLSIIAPVSSIIMDILIFYHILCIPRNVVIGVVHAAEDKRKTLRE